MPQLLPTRFATECIREFELAATERYLDAIQLADSGRRTGAIYLFGYVVEMLLKARYFRLIGFTETQAISMTDLRFAVSTSAASTARSLGLPGTSNFHNVSAWADLIVAYRTHHGFLYAEPGFDAALSDNVRAIQARWTEVLRYHKNVAYSHEMNIVRTCCGWIVSYRGTI